MKIVHIEDFIHPDAGYQVNLLSRLQARDGHDVTIVTAELDKVPSFLTTFFGKDNIKEKDAAFERETGVRIIRLPLITWYSHRAFFYPSIFNVVDDLQPDIAFVHGEDSLTGMRFIWRSSKLGYPIVLDCHMLEMASVHRFREAFRAFYRLFVTPTILKNNIPLIRVVNSDFVEKCLGIPLSHTDLLALGTDTTYFTPDPNAAKRLRSEYGFSNDSFLVLYAGKLDVNKGGQFLADALIEPLTSARGRRVEFLIVGNADGDYGAKVEAAFAQSRNKIVRLPTQKYVDLPRYYAGVDLALFPRQCSLSFFEVQSCGVPVLFEENEINAQRAGHGNAILFRPQDVSDLRQKILELADMSPEQRRAMSDNARRYVLNNYDYLPISRQFTKVLQRAVDAWNKKRAMSAVVSAE
jgi:glycosyltransferase involved in cell wall biosynthesis